MLAVKLSQLFNVFYNELGALRMECENLYVDFRKET